MSENEDKDKTEQITKETENNIEKIKDPKKVQAGKRLVEYHKKAKQALENEKKHGNNDIDSNDDNKKWIPEISFTTALTLVGITLTAVDLYLKLKKSNNQTPKPKSNIDSEDIEQPTAKTITHLSKIPRKIGME